MIYDTDIRKYDEAFPIRMPNVATQYAYDTNKPECRFFTTQVLRDPPNTDQPS
jgi:hypothetical protein